MKNMTNELEIAISEQDGALIKELLSKGAEPNGDGEYPLISYISDEIEDSGWGVEGLDILRLFLESGADVDGKAINYGQSSTLLQAVGGNELEIVKLLLEFGADSGLINEEGDNCLSMSLSTSNLYITSLLLEHGARSYIDDYRTISVYTALEYAVRYCGIDMVKLLLDNGADPLIPSEFHELMISVLEKSEVEYSADEQKDLRSLLDPSNPPYLKLDSSGNKYTIFKRNGKNIDQLANLDRNEKFLYHGFDIALFIYWAFNNNGFVDSINKQLNNSIGVMNEITSEALVQALSDVSQEWTVGFFTGEMKHFVVNYLTISSWAFSLHFDLKKLYPTENAFAKIPEKKEDYSKVFKLFDARYEQSKCKKWFNSNQRQEDLLALL